MLLCVLLGPITGSILNSLTHAGLRLAILGSTVVITSGFVASAWCNTAVQAILTFGLISGKANFTLSMVDFDFCDILVNHII